MQIERRQRVRRWGPSALSGSAALLTAVLALSTNVASSTVPAAWAAAHRGWVWAVTGGLALVTVALAAVAGWPRREASPPPGEPVVRGGAPLSYRAAAVQSLLPTDGLRERDQELRRLGGFAHGESSYLMVRSPAYGGKTALLAAFVTHPPAGAAVVAYFTIGRIAGQSTRPAFVHDVLDQLSELSGDRLEVPDDPLAREAVLLTRLRDQAAALAGSGRRLVLVVDGLDEDRGAGAEPDTASIAAVLPRHPVPGLRVVVSCRSGRPVPPDVPADHPLRRAEVLELAPYRGAEADRDAARQELRRLLTGSELDRDVLGLVVAAGGRLTRADLAELTGRAPFELDPVLDGPAGRSFAYHEASADGAGYLLAHDTLQVEAVEKFGGGRLDAYRNRLSDWAGGYRRRGWPDTTPRYLLFDLPQMLYAAGEAGRLFELAVDVVRRQRLFESSGGGDRAALTELRLAHELLMKQADPDLVSAAVVALHHEYVVRRNEFIPAGLPGVWFDLGEPTRAYALAHSMSDPAGQSHALTSFAISTAVRGEADQAVGFVRSIPHDEHRVDAAGRLARAMASRGDVESVEAMLDVIDEVDGRASGKIRRGAVAMLPGEALRSGHTMVAERLAERLEARYRVWSSLARVAAERADADAARRCLRAAWTAVRAGEPDVYEVAEVVAAASVVLGPGPELDACLAEAETTALMLAASAGEETKTGYLVATVAEAGDPDRADRMLASVRGGYDRGVATRGILRGLASMGRGADAEGRLSGVAGDELFPATVAVIEGARLADDRPRVKSLACGLADRIGNGDGWDPLAAVEGRGELLAALVWVDELDRAESLVAAAAHQPVGNDAVLGELVMALLDCGRGRKAREILAAGRTPRFYNWDRFFEALLKNESPSSFAQVVGGLDATRFRLAGWTWLARHLTDGGRIDEARRYAELATRDARALARPPGQDDALLSLVEALAGAGDGERARLVVREIEKPASRGLGLIALPPGPGRAAAADIDEVLRLRELITDHGSRPRVMDRLAEAVKSGHWEAEDLLLRKLDSPDRALILVAAAHSAPVEQRGEALAAAEQAFRETLQISHYDATWPFGLSWRMADALYALDGPERLLTFLESVAAASQSVPKGAGVTDDVAIAAVRALTDGGELTDAETAARAIVRPASRSWALAYVAVAWADRRDPARSLSVVADLTDPAGHDSALSDISARLVEAGDTAGAEEVAATIQSHQVRAAALSVIAPAWCGADAARARALLVRAESALPPFSRSGPSYPYQRLAVAWCLIGDVDRALALVGALGAEAAWSALTDLLIRVRSADEGVRRFADAVLGMGVPRTSSISDDRRGTVAGLLLGLGLDDLARGLYPEDPSSTAWPWRHDLDEQHKTLPELLAVTAARRGERRHAGEIAATESADHRRALLFHQLAEVAGDADPGFRKRMLGRSLMLRPWGPAWSKVLTETAEAVPVLADTYLSLWTAPRPEDE